MKERISDFAVFGGRPLFEQPLHVGEPSVPPRQRVLDRIARVLDSGRLTNNGPVLKQFEEEIRRVAGVRHCVAVCNGTMALQIMAKACGLTGEVIVPSLTFIATAHALEWIGLTPVFADVRTDDHTLDADSVRRCITSQTSAILGVHLWGNPCDVSALAALAEEHNLELLFDASHAFGCRAGGEPIGGFGRAEAFSFHATKFVHSIEGGAIVTNCDVLAERMRQMRAFGITGLTTVASGGTNGKLNEISAAVGLTSLSCLPDHLLRNRQTQADYRTGIADCPGIRIVECTADDGGNGQYAVLTVDAEQFGLTRDQLLQVLRAEGVLARSYFVPGCHGSAPYCDTNRHQRVALPATQRILDTVIQCPAGPSATRVVVKTVCGLIHRINEHSADIRTQLTNARPAFSHADDPAVAAQALPRAG